MRAMLTPTSSFLSHSLSHSLSLTASTSSAMSGSAHARSLRFARVLGKPQPISTVVHAHRVALMDAEELPPGAEVDKLMSPPLSPLKPLFSPAPHKLRKVARDTRTTFSRGAAVTCSAPRIKGKQDKLRANGFQRCNREASTKAMN